METLAQSEAVPAEYPTSGHDALWQRIEAYCAHRWTPREVKFLVQGPCQWAAPLFPFVMTGARVWASDQFVDAFPAPSPFGGFILQAVGPYQITATVGSDNPAPAAVLEAFERLRDYVEAEAGAVPGASSYSINTGQISESIRRDPAFMAKALQLSGAADLLRPYRRA